MYDMTNYGLIRGQLVTDHTKFSVNNRAQLLDDAFNLATLNTIAYADAFDLTIYLRNEKEFTPWEAVLPELDFIHFMFVDDSAYQNWKVCSFFIIKVDNPSTCFFLKELHERLSRSVLDLHRFRRTSK